MKYIDADRLKTEIERLGRNWDGVQELQPVSLFQADLYELLDIINSLQQEQPSLPDNLDEAAEEYLKYHKLETASIRKLSMYRSLAFKAGAEWQKEQMMKEAVEGYVNYYEDSGGILMAEAQVGCPYHNGDKVRIVVLKAEEDEE